MSSLLKGSTYKQNTRMKMEGEGKRRQQADKKHVSLWHMGFPNYAEINKYIGFLRDILRDIQAQTQTHRHTHTWCLSDKL